MTALWHVSYLTLSKRRYVRSGGLGILEFFCVYTVFQKKKKRWIQVLVRDTLSLNPKRINFKGEEKEKEPVELQKRPQKWEERLNRARIKLKIEEQLAVRLQR